MLSTCQTMRAGSLLLSSRARGTSKGDGEAHEVRELTCSETRSNCDCLPACDHCRRTKSRCGQPTGGPKQRSCFACAALGLSTLIHLNHPHFSNLLAQHAPSLVSTQITDNVLVLLTLTQTSHCRPHSQKRSSQRVSTGDAFPDRAHSFTFSGTFSPSSGGYIKWRRS